MNAPREWRRRRNVLRFAAMLLVTLAPAAALADADVSVVTILADFEDESVAPQLTELQNVLPAECAVRRQAIPARGQFCLATDIGATAGNVSVTCELRFREPTRFAQADRVAAFYWLKEGELQLAFRVRDARDQVFESPPQVIREKGRWVEVGAELDPARLRRIRGDGPLSWPLQIAGYRVATSRLGKQTLFLDDLQVAHRVSPRDTVRSEFVLSEATRIYRPGATVGAKLVVENRSRTQTLALAIELAWTDPDGAPLKTDQSSISLPPSGRDFRSRQPVDFSQPISAPGLYRLEARVRAASWAAPNVATTSLAVVPATRLAPRGRSIFFGVGTDLLSEPAADQRLEIELAKTIGIQVLAIKTPWRRIEPVGGQYDLEALDGLVDALAQKEIAPLLMLTAPPEWAGTADRPGRLGALLAHLARHFGPKVVHYMVDASVLPAQPGEREEALAGLQTALSQARPGLRLIGPPRPVGSADSAGRAAPAGGGAPVQRAYQTRGDTAAALVELADVLARGGGAWQSSDWWLHQAAPLVGPTFLSDADAVIRHYVRAALAGVGSLVWFDLRDTDNDPQQPERLTGLVRRDFSPKTSLLGYASAVGALAGLACRGEVLGTPPEFESALFVGSDRQRAVLLPRPNRRYPAVLAAVQGVPGEFEVQDFEQRRGTLVSATSPVLVATQPRPIIVTLRPENTQPEPQIAFVPPWISVPGIVFAGQEEPFTVRLAGVAGLKRGYARVNVPADAPLTVTPPRQSLGGSEQPTSELVFRLAVRPDQPFERAAIQLKLGLDDRTIDVPLEARPIVTIAPAGAGALDPARHRLGGLAGPPKTKTTASGTVLAGFTPEHLKITVRLKDDRLLPTALGPDLAVTGDDLRVGVAVEGADQHAEARVDTAGSAGTLVPLPSTDAAEVAQWTCDVQPGAAADERIVALTIPAAALGGRLAAGAHLLLAVRYTDADATDTLPVILHWGGGLDGRHSSAEFRWARLAE